MRFGHDIVVEIWMCCCKQLERIKPVYAVKKYAKTIDGNRIPHLLKRTTHWPQLIIKQLFAPFTVRGRRQPHPHGTFMYHKKAYWYYSTRFKIKQAKRGVFQRKRICYYTCFCHFDLCLPQRMLHASN